MKRKKPESLSECCAAPVIKGRCWWCKKKTGP